VNLQTNGYGNDFGLDDFLFAQFCSSSDSVQLTIAPAPYLGADTTICSNTSVLLDAGNADSYLWNTGSTTQNINVNSPGQYIVNATTDNCVFTDTINVSVTPVPQVNLGPDTILCGLNSIELFASGTPQTTYLWNTGSINPTILADSTGTYSVMVSLLNCSSNDSIHVTVLRPVNLGNDISLCGVFNQKLDAGNPGATYLWSTGSTDQTIDVNSPGEYWVEVNDGACVSRDTIEASGTSGEGILFIPNTFTPDGNNINDKFYVYGDGISSFDMKIFNRWGQLIFETKDMNEGWDGKYKGEIVQTDTYVYVINYKNQCSGEQLKKEIGHVNVIK
ncbi:MAG TPA: gliding motility-associated C-terminal domain-containing protein, partial [Bacteroidia bacterium]|nr:gliding motility-associated C-terminal domain-containing protein [Bacteroidia bacterium]